MKGIIPRFFDIVTAGGATLVRDAGGEPIVVVDATDVALLYERSEQQVWDVGKDFPCLAPPFPAMFIEAQFPWEDHHEWTNQLHERDRVVLGGNVFRSGVFFLADKREGGLILEAHVFNGSDGREALLGTKPFSYLGSARIRLDPDGSAAAEQLGPNGGIAVIAGPDLSRALEMGVLSTSQVAGSVLSALHSALLAISFMHCKNIVLTKVDPYEGKPKSLRKHGNPFVRFHTLDIAPMRTVLRRDGASEHGGLKKALHICRGHFRHYVDKGLFGREELKGLFWTPQHARGDVGLGVVEKDYRIRTDEPAESG